LGLAAGLAGLCLSYLLVRRLFTPWLSMLATVTVAAGSFVAWYLFREPGTIHPFSIAAAAVACWSWMRSREAAGSRRTGWLALCGAAAVAALALRVHAGLVHPGTPGMAELLWSSRNGLFAWSPALYLAALGLVPLWRRDRPLAAAGAALFGLVCLTSAPDPAAARAGFGGRQFDILIPFFIGGLAAMLDWITRAAARRPALAAAALLGTLVLWNVTLMAVTRAGGHRIGEPVSFGDLAARQAATLHDWIGHPSSWPANLLYAIRHRVSPGRYDVLMPGRFFADAARREERIDIGTDDSVYLEDGWHDDERAGTLTFRWVSREAHLIVALDRAESLRVLVAMQAFNYASAPAQSVVLFVNGRPLTSQVVEPDWHQLEWIVPRDAWRSGVNRLTFRFARESRPADVGAGTDGRHLAAALDTIHFSRSQ
jgi:hypothetical protein